MRRFRALSQGRFERLRLIRSAEEIAGGLGYRREMSTRGRRLASTLRRHPVAFDSILAAALAGASLVSLYTTFELLRQDPKFQSPDETGIVAFLLLVTLPLALRRRLPLAVPIVVVAAFVIGRIALHPAFPGLQWELYMTVWACWL